MKTPVSSRPGLAIFSAVFLMATCIGYAASSCLMTFYDRGADSVKLARSMNKLPQAAALFIKVHTERRLI